MRNTKKLVGLLLALVMILAVGAAAFADGTNSITVENAVKGQTYKLYKMLDLVVNDAHTAYSYTVNADWKDFFVTSDTNTSAPGSSYVNIDALGYVTWKENANVEDFAKAAEEYAKNLTELKKHDASADGDFTFADLEAGYYLVTSTLGTKATVGTTPGEPNPTIHEKNAAPTNVKTVEEDSTPGTYGEINDADIGQIVNFKSTITAQAGAENYVFHDKMSEGLTFGGSVYVTLNGNAVDASNYTFTDYTVQGATTPTDGCTFEVSFKQNFCDTLAAGNEIVISYTATLNEKAVIAGAGNPNTSKVSYGVKDGTTTNEPSGETPPSKTTTYTWQFDILKYANGDKNTVLKDAKFVLLNSDRSKVATIKNGKLDSWINIPSAQEGAEIQWPEAAVLTTDENGKAAIAGLDADTYYLREIAAPAGYNKLAGDVTVIISPTASEDGKTLTLASVTAEIENKSGTELPSTGGIGTTIFYVIGGVLVIGAAAMLIAKRKKA